MGGPLRLKSSSVSRLAVISSGRQKTNSMLLPCNIQSSEIAAASFSTSVVCRKMYDYDKMSIKEMEEEMRREQKKKKEQEYALYPLVAACAFASGYGVYHTCVKYFPKFSLVRLPRRDEVAEPLGKMITVVPRGVQLDTSLSIADLKTISKLAEEDENE